MLTAHFAGEEVEFWILLSNEFSPVSAKLDDSLAIFFTHLRKDDNVAELMPTTKVTYVHTQVRLTGCEQLMEKVMVLPQVHCVMGHLATSL